jgi:hypothetical protein
MNPQVSLRSLTLKTIVAHTLTYFLMGLLASNLLNYRGLFAVPAMACYMRPFDDPLIALAIVAQPVRGIIFALVFYPLREIFFGRKNGWLILWWTLVGLGIFSTFGPATGSVEGLMFTQVPVADQLIGLLEVIPQAGLLAGLVTYWVNHPEKKWINWLLGILFAIAILLPILGTLALQMQ